MIAIISDPMVGGTFLSWTIYYLSGKNQYYSTRTNSVVDLPDNPLTNKNAHNFIANHPLDIVEFDKFLALLIGTDECIYMHKFISDTQLAVDKLCKQAEQLIVLESPPEVSLYYCGKSRVRNIILKDFFKCYFKESTLMWDDQELSNIWDRREFIALNFDHTPIDSITNYINSTVQHYYINSIDLWLNFNQSVYRLFDYLKLDVNTVRYQSWVVIYNQWRQFHLPGLNFSWYFDAIVNGILNGNEFDLTPFNLDIYQEAAIQRELIYKHNLNLKTWQLTKFVNTKQLHDLLEPNIHITSGRLTT